MKLDQAELLNQYNVTRTSADSLKAKSVSLGDSQAEQVSELLDTYSQDVQSQDLQAAYRNPKMTMDSEAVQRLMKETQEIGGSVKQMVRDLLDRQGLTESQLANGEVDQVSVDETARKKAQEMIGPGGELSAEKVSDRIVDFAISAFGGDKSKIDIIRSSIDRGFKEAEKMLGGLSDVSKETYTMIQDKLDKWINEGTEETTTSGTEQADSAA